MISLVTMSHPHWDDQFGSADFRQRYRATSTVTTLSLSTDTPNETFQAV
jgi:hypothetical protein